MRNIWNLVARNRNYRLLLGANFVSAAGDWIMNIGMTFYVYVITGSVLASGIMLMVAMLPMLLFGSLAGVFVDRWDRRATMITTNLLLAATLVPLFIMDGKSDIWILYVVVFAQGILEQLFAPAESAMVPHVVPSEDLVAANALNQQNRELTRLLGAALGGLLAATGGIVLVAIVDLVSYLVAAALLIMMRVPPQPKLAAVERDKIRNDWVAGIRLCFSRKDLATLFVFRSMNGFGEGVFSVLLAPFVIGILHANGTEFGALSAIQAVGGIAGGLAVASMSRRFTPRQLLGFGALLFGAVDLLIALYPLAFPALWPMFLLMIVVGLPGAAQGAGFSTLQQERTPDAYRGRIFGAINTGSAIAMTAGIVLASVLGDVIGIIAVLSLQGIVHLLAGPYVLARLGSQETPQQPETRPVVLAGGEA
jgi:MFS family permease